MTEREKEDLMYALILGPTFGAVLGAALDGSLIMMAGGAVMGLCVAGVVLLAIVTSPHAGSRW